MIYRGLSIVAASMRLDASSRERLRSGFIFHSAKLNGSWDSTSTDLVFSFLSRIMSASFQPSLERAKSPAALAATALATGSPYCAGLLQPACALTPGMCLMSDMPVYMVSTGSSICLPETIVYSYTLCFRSVVPQQSCMSRSLREC